MQMEKIHVPVILQIHLLTQHDPVNLICSTRVSNELGAGNPRAAQGSVNVVVILGVADAVIVSILFVCCRHILGYAYSNDKEVADYVADMVPFLCVSVSVDSLIGVFSGEFLFDVLFLT